VGVLNPATPQDLKWTPDLLERTARGLAERTLLLPDTDLVLWPEGVGYASAEEGSDTFFGDLAQVGGRWLVAGLLHPEAGGRWSNAAVLFDPTGRLRGIYRKQHLVPFGEYVPLEGVIPWGGLTAQAGHLATGRDEPLLRHPLADLGPAVCFESLFAEPALSQADRGAGILVVISNDAWYTGTPAPEQLAWHTRVRALECGRDLVRSANGGYSFHVDALGRMDAPLPPAPAGAAVFRVQPRTGRTPYVRWRNLPWWLVFAAALGLFFWPAGRS